MSKRLTRREMVQKDEFVSVVERGMLWLERHWRTLLGVTAGLVAAVLLGAGLSSWLGSRSHAAEALLAAAMDVSRAPILRQGELPPLGAGPVFASQQERDAAALEKLDEVMATYPSSRAAGRAAYLRGAVLLRLDRAAEAVTALERYLQDHSSSDLAPAARRTLAAARIAAGEVDAGLGFLEELVARPSPVFPADAALMELARAQEAAGRQAAAAATYQRLVNEHAQSVYAGEAGQAFARLSAAGVAPAGGDDTP